MYFEKMSLKQKQEAHFEPNEGSGRRLSAKLFHFIYSETRQQTGFGKPTPRVHLHQSQSMRSNTFSSFKFNFVCARGSVERQEELGELRGRIESRGTKLR